MSGMAKIKGMGRTRLVTVLIAATTLLVVGGSLALPVPQQNDWFGFHAYFGITLAIALLNVGAAILFMMGVGGFTKALQRSYLFISIGIALLGLSLAQLPLVIYSGHLEEFWRDSGLAALPIVAALVVLFVGTRAFARLFTIKNITTSPLIALGAVVLLSVLFSVLPHAPISTTESMFDMQNSFSVLNTVIVALGMLHILQVKRVASIMYTAALAWLALAFGTMTVAGLGYLFALLSFGDQQWYLTGALPLIPTCVAALFLVRSAYAFNAVTVQGQGDFTKRDVTRTFFGTRHKPGADAPLSSLDIIMYAANLASDSRAVDPILDRMRYITSRLEPGQPLSSSDEAELSHVYLELEEYLLHKEPVRKFSKEELRTKITERLHISAQPTFWNSLR
jgi:hypothetical protein